MLCLLSHVCSVHASEAICILQAAARNVFGVGEDPAHVKFHILSESGPCFFRRVNNTALRICATPLAIFEADEKMSDAVEYRCKATAKTFLFKKPQASVRYSRLFGLISRFILAYMHVATLA